MNRKFQERKQISVVARPIVVTKYWVLLPFCLPGRNISQRPFQSRTVDNPSNIKFCKKIVKNAHVLSPTINSDTQHHHQYSYRRTPAPNPRTPPALAVPPLGPEPRSLHAGRPADLAPPLLHRHLPHGPCRLCPTSRGGPAKPAAVTIAQQLPHACPRFRICELAVHGHGVRMDATWRCGHVSGGRGPLRGAGVRDRAGKGGNSGRCGYCELAIWVASGA